MLFKLSSLLLFLPLLNCQSVNVKSSGKNPLYFDIEATGQFEEPLASFGLLSGASYSLNFEYTLSYTPSENIRSLVLIGLNETWTEPSAGFCRKKDEAGTFNPANGWIVMNLTGSAPVFNFSTWIDAPKAKLWTTFVIQCVNSTSSSDQASKITVRNLVLTMINPHNNFLSAGDIPLPALYYVMFVVYVFVFGYWVKVLRESTNTLLWIHRLMTGVLVLKWISCLFHAIKYDSMSHGYDAEGISIVYYIFALLRGGLNVAVMVLIGSGWLFIKAALNKWEVRIIVVVVVTHLASLIAHIVQEEAVFGSGTWKNAQFFVFLDFVGLGLLLFPVAGTQSRLDQEAPGKAVLGRKKYKLWSRFYVWTVFYIMFAQLFKLIWVEMTSFTHFWGGSLVEELVTLAFYISTGYYFRPVENNPYFHLSDEERAEQAELMELERSP